MNARKIWIPGIFALAGFSFVAFLESFLSCSSFSLDSGSSFSSFSLSASEDATFSSDSSLADSESSWSVSLSWSCLSSDFSDSSPIRACLSFSFSSARAASSSAFFFRYSWFRFCHSDNSFNSSRISLSSFFLSFDIYFPYDKSFFNN
ncbi:Uncharacterised protein [Streptococcus pneumoniae]|nr:Uncharacterised protein [Streptococcus pneumoniae]